MGDVVDLNARRAKRTEPLLNKRQAAEHLGALSTRWVEYQQREHGLPFRRVGGTCLYYASELNEWVERRHRESQGAGRDSVTHLSCAAAVTPSARGAPG